MESLNESFSENQRNRCVKGVREEVERENTKMQNREGEERSILKE
jgi:hypothetical protein